ncbi:MAG: GMC family oxidoreductase [Novosphingobium sp.]
MSTPPPSGPAYDYVVIGSGAGGGTLAARLVEAGRSVLVIEAGPDPLGTDLPGATSTHYRVPAFHAYASEDSTFGWAYHVSHFDDRADSAGDRNLGAEGIYYPRAAALGGCTAHNAMIWLPPPDADWDALAELTGDPGWGAEAMRRHRLQVENCRHRWAARIAARLGFDTTGHGWSGWLPVEHAMPLSVLGDPAMVRAIARVAIASLARDGDWADRLRRFVGYWGDPNTGDAREGEALCYLPLATRRHVRSGTRERLRAVAARHPDRLTIATDTFVTAIRFDGQRAIGVDWQRGRGLHGDAKIAPDTVGLAAAGREVIVCAGAFATPQLLQLSGIGDPALLAAHGVPLRAASPQVGQNLQDRYEIGVVHRTARPWRALRGARFAAGDRLYRHWRRFGRGMYASNGCAVAALRRSTQATRSDPDLVLMGLIGRFSGYRPGYASETWCGDDGFTWAVLKGRTGNRAGSVTIRSPDAREPPRIAFRNFTQGGEADLTALVEGVEMARALTAPLIERGLVAEEEWPGPACTGAALRERVRASAWGHHACGTAAIGPVLDSQGRVHGVTGLRVCDASIFPQIPGLFIAAAIMMAAEKIAADMLGAEADS